VAYYYDSSTYPPPEHGNAAGRGKPTLGPFQKQLDARNQHRCVSSAHSLPLPLAHACCVVCRVCRVSCQMWILFLFVRACTGGGR
jgi:hypothetical protein